MKNKADDSGQASAPDAKHSGEVTLAIEAARLLVEEAIDTQRRQLDRAEAVLEATKITFDEDEEVAAARAADILDVVIALVAGVNESLDSVNMKEIWRKASA